MRSQRKSPPPDTRHRAEAGDFAVRPQCLVQRLARLFGRYGRIPCGSCTKFAGNAFSVSRRLLSARIWEAVKDGPNLVSLSLDSFFPGLLGPDGALPARVQKIECPWESIAVSQPAEFTLKAIDCSENLVEWFPNSDLDGLLSLLEKYQRAASKLRRVPIYSSGIDELSKYAKYCTNLESLKIVGRFLVGDFWPLVSMFPSLGEVDVEADGSSQISEPLLRRDGQLAGLARGPLSRRLCERSRSRSLGLEQTLAYSRSFKLEN